MHVLNRYALAALGLAVFCAGSLQAAELDRGLPEDTSVVVHINVRQILNSRLFKEHARAEIEKAIQGNKSLRQGLSALGLDPLKDITSITLAAPGEKDQKKWVAFVHGSFDVMRVSDTADKLSQKDPDKFLIHKQSGVRLYEIREESTPIFGTLLSRDSLVVSPDRGYVSDAIAKGSGSRANKLNKALTTMVAKQDSRQSVWMASLVTKAMRDEMGKNAQTRKLAEKLQSLSAGVNLGDDITINALIDTSDGESAAEIRQQLMAVKALATFAITSAKDLEEVRPMILEVLNSFKVRQKGNTVDMGLTISGKLIEKLGNQLKSR